MVVEIFIHRTKNTLKKYPETHLRNIMYQLHNLTLSTKLCCYVVCSVDTQLSQGWPALVCLALRAVQNDFAYGYFNFY